MRPSKVAFTVPLDHLDCQSEAKEEQPMHKIHKMQPKRIKLFLSYGFFVQKEIHILKKGLVEHQSMENFFDFCRWITFRLYTFYGLVKSARGG